MKRLFFCVSLLLFVFICFSNDFISNQKTYPRVRTAYQEKELILKNRLKEQGLSLENLHILIVAYKAEKELEIFAKSKQQKKFVKIGTYNICRTSGNLGPKNKSGDYQTPEGFYSIDRFNPSSSYYLSLGINYPNQTDRIRSKALNLGGDIFIHGKCVTIGCLPMTNEGINEIYLYAINAKQNGQNNIPVYIFPYRLSKTNIKIYTEAYKNYPELLSFWDNLKLGYDKFNKEREPLIIKTTMNGTYNFQ